MSKYLTQTTEVYRVDTEGEVEILLNEVKNNSQYDLNKYSSQFKEVKKQGEVIDEYYLVTLVKSFTSAKEPDRQVEVYYGKEGGETNAF